MTPQAELFSALSTDATILTIVDSDTTKITQTYPPMDMLNNPDGNFPRITYNESSRAHIFFTDNIPKMDRIVYRVDIWVPITELVNYTLSTVGREVDRVMISLGYRKSDSNDETLTTEKVYVRTLEYLKEISSNR